MGEETAAAVLEIFWRTSVSRSFSIEFSYPRMAAAAKRGMSRTEVVIPKDVEVLLETSSE